MNARTLARNAYSQASVPTRTPRSTEFDAFAKVTRQMQQCSGRGIRELASAIHENRRLWTILAADVLGEGNGLSEILRGRILYLSEFTRHHSSKVLRGEASVAPLVEINTAIMRGLGAGEVRA